jgi:Flp pilus assembly protein TadG
MLKKYTQRLLKLKSERGASMPMIAAAMIPIVGALGGAVDLANLYMVRSQLRDAVDSAALTGGRLYYATDRDTQVNNYLTSNLPALTTGNTLKSLTITPAAAGAGTTLTVNAEVDVKTFLMSILGIDTITTKASATVERRSNGIELVLALDNTVSMDRTDGGTVTRIEALKSATRDFIGVLYGGTTDNPNLNISIMPYTGYVNVGKLLIDEQAATGRTYLETIPGYSYNPADGLGWKGCVDEPDTDKNIDISTDPADDGRWNNAYDTKEFLPGVSGAPLFRPTLVPSFGNEYMVTHTGGTSCSGPGTYWRDGEEISYSGSGPSCVATPSTPLPTPYSAVDGHAYQPPAGYETSSDWVRKNGYYTGTPNSSWPVATTYPAGGGNSPNTYCPAATLALKPHNKAVLDNYINTELKAFNMGWGVEGTFSHTAMAWAYRMLTPALPFAAPAKTTSRDKVIVMMTDGILSQSRNESVRSGYGYTEEKRLINSDGDTAADRIASEQALEARMKRLCVMAKREGIIVYTVTFKVPSTDPKAQLYKDCASDPSKYFSPDDASSLKTAFTEIASDLSSIRIVK